MSLGAPIWKAAIATTVPLACLVLSLWTLWPLMAVAGLTWLLAVSRRYSAHLAVCSAVGVVLLTTFAAALLGPVVHLSLGWVVRLMLVAASLAGAVVLARLSHDSPADRPRDWRALVSVSAPAGVWLLTVAAAQFLPEAAGMSWAIRGDAAPHTVQALDILHANGVTPDIVAQNPVPLLHVLIAAIAGAGGLSSLDVAIHATAQVWAVLIALSCLASGLVARHYARVAGASVVMSTIAGVCAAVFSLTWFTTGYQLDYGFVNAPLAIFLVLAVLGVATRVRESPWLVIATSLGAGFALAVTWSPLALLPAAALGVAAVRAITTRARPARALAMALALGVAVVAWYGVFYLLPVLGMTGTALATDGGLAPLPPAMLPIVAAVCFALLFVGRARRGWLIASIGSVLVATLVGLAFMVLIAGNPPFHGWTYYPLKYSWLITAALAPVCLGLLWSVGVRSPRWGRWVAVTSGVAVVGLAGGFVLVPHATVQRVTTPPAFEILAGTVFGDADDVFDKVIATNDPTLVPVLWGTNDPLEMHVNHWTLQVARRGLDDKARDILHVRSHFIEDAGAVCQLGEALGSDRLLVLTSGAAQVEAIQALCPEVAVTLGDWDADAIAAEVERRSQELGGS